MENTILAEWPSQQTKNISLLDIVSETISILIKWHLEWIKILNKALFWENKTENKECFKEFEINPNNIFEIPIKLKGFYEDKNCYILEAIENSELYWTWKNYNEALVDFLDHLLLQWYLINTPLKKGVIKISNLYGFWKKFNAFILHIIRDEYLVNLCPEYINALDEDSRRVAEGLRKIYIEKNCKINIDNISNPSVFEDDERWVILFENSVVAIGFFKNKERQGFWYAYPLQSPFVQTMWETKEIAINSLLEKLLSDRNKS